MRSEKKILLLVAVLALILLGGSAQPSIALEIQNVVITPIDAGTFNVTWTTDVPTQAQVLMLEGNKQAYWKTPLSPLQTTHAATLDRSWTGKTEYFHILAYDASGTLAKSEQLNVTLPQPDPLRPYDWRVRMTGTHNVVQGHDAYVMVSSALLNGNLSVRAGARHTITGRPPNARFRLFCRLNTAVERVCGGSEVLDNGTIDIWDQSIYSMWAYTTSGYGLWRISIPNDTPVGKYTIVFNITSGNKTQIIPYDLTVHPTPPPPTRQSIESPRPPVPERDIWEEEMILYAKKYCPDPNVTMGFGWEGAVWFYDGARVFYNLAQYTGNDNWLACGDTITRDYSNWLITLNGGAQGWKMFPHGLAMHYNRTGSETSKQALVLLSERGSTIPDGGRLDPQYMRETAYALDTLVYRERVGMPQHIMRNRSVDLALAQFDQVFVSNQGEFLQPFFTGLMAEALILHYEDTGDTRVPPAIKTMLDWLWDNAVNQTSGWTIYNPADVPGHENADLNFLFAPAFAWYYNLTGDPVYRERGDLLFAAAARNSGAYWSGKSYSQTYRSTFEYMERRDPFAITRVEIESEPTVLGFSFFTSKIATIEATATSANGVRTIRGDKARDHVIRFEGLAPATQYNITITARSETGSVAVYTKRITTNPSPSATPLLAFVPISATGSFLDSNGTKWVSDANYSVSNEPPSWLGYYINNTNDQNIYRSLRHQATPIRYHVPIADGTYVLTFYHAENHLLYRPQNIGDRRMDYIINGVKVDEDFDILRNVPIRWAYLRSYTITASNGRGIDIEIVPKNGYAKFSGVKITAAPNGTAAKLGDVNGDGAVNVQDITLASRSLGPVSNGSLADLAQPQGTIDVFDLVAILLHFD
jgi:hypothetical protein